MCRSFEPPEDLYPKIFWVCCRLCRCFFTGRSSHLTNPLILLSPWLDTVIFISAMRLSIANLYDIIFHHDKMCLPLGVITHMNVMRIWWLRVYWLSIGDHYISETILEDLDGVRNIFIQSAVFIIILALSFSDRCIRNFDLYVFIERKVHNTLPEVRALPLSHKIPSAILS